MTSNFGVPQITDENTRDALNRALDSATAFGFPDMQRAFERVSKVLMTNNIFLNKIDDLHDEEGLDVSMASQGAIDDTGLSIYFEWQREDNGLFSVFCNVVDDTDLEELLNNSDHLDKLPDWDDSMPSEPYSETQKKWANKQLSESKPYSTMALANEPENFASVDDLTNAAGSMTNKSTREQNPALKSMYLSISKNLIDKGRAKLEEEAKVGNKLTKFVDGVKTGTKTISENKGSVWKKHKDSE